jgi:hypothetical protein
VSAREFGRQLVRALGARMADREIRDLLDDIEQTMDYASEGWAQADRYRSAWESARQRAANHGLALVEADEERDGLRVEVVQLGQHGEQLEARLAAIRSACKYGSDRIGRIETAAIVALADGDPEILRDWTMPDDEVSAATDRLRAALSDAQVEERIEEIKRTARERIEARRLRAALDEERIEPERVNGHGKWCSSLHAPPGQTYACDCNEVGAG